MKNNNENKFDKFEELIKEQMKYNSAVTQLLKQASTIEVKEIDLTRDYDKIFKILNKPMSLSEISINSKIPESELIIYLGKLIEERKLGMNERWQYYPL